MKLEIHFYHHHYYHPRVNDRDGINTFSCNLAVNNGTGDISYHDYNVKYSGRCYGCFERVIRGYYFDGKGIKHGK